MSLFGTDGIRGKANQVLTPELAFRIGLGAGRWLSVQDGLPHRAVIGRDTRRSGPMLGAALASGLCSAGIETVVLGIAPTPAVAFVAKTGEYGLGGVISASHNPAPDNGIKLVGHDGAKLPDAAESTIASLMDPDLPRPTGSGIGWMQSDRRELENYVDALCAMAPEGLAGLRVAVDAAHGAAYDLAPEVLDRLGAEVFLRNAEPDGDNINVRCGATNPDSIQAWTVETGAQIGVAFDGDADRAVFSDAQGRLVNGDYVLAMWATHHRASAAVGTVMTNGALAAYLSTQGVALHRAAVGDKHVARMMAEVGAPIGGEQSGHLIFPHRFPTGDGLITMLEVLTVLRASGRSLDSYRDLFENFPQILVNLKVDNKEALKGNARIEAAVRAAEERLGDQGRLNLRPSGTEPKVRLMVEATSYDLRDAVAADLEAVLLEELGGSASRTDLTHALGD